MQLVVVMAVRAAVKWEPPPRPPPLWGGVQTPMQLVTPKVVRIAVRMAIIVWMMNFQVSFFMIVSFELMSS